jgi:hypothetical protein
MKPLVRWTIGEKTGAFSYDCLRRSIYFLRKLYGNSLDYVVCHNGLDVPQFDLGAPVIKQEPYVNSLSVPPQIACWKLYPPRLRPEGHEIFIDNDILITKQISCINLFIENSNHCFASEALHRNFGMYDRYVKSGVKINNGFFGVPPNFDLSAKIENTLLGNWHNYFDDQGIIASILHKEPNFELVPLSEIWICATEIRPAKCGYHFVGLNGGLDEYYHTYLQKTIYGKMI